MEARLRERLVGQDVVLEAKVAHFNGLAVTSPRLAKPWLTGFPIRRSEIHIEKPVRPQSYDMLP